MKTHSEPPIVAPIEVKYPIESRSFSSYDGTRIGYHVTGRGKIPLVVANGLGGNWVPWKFFIDYFGDRFRIYIWDYRGLYTSQRPKDLSTLSVPNQCRDLEILMEKENIPRAIFAGWSMGVQVCFEYYREHADRFNAIVAFSGVDGKPFDSFVQNVRLRATLPRFITLLERMGGPQKKAMDWLLKQDWAFDGMKLLGIVGKTCAEEIFRSVAAEFINMDFEVYYRTLNLLGEHDAGDVLPDVKVPVLIAFGDHDNMTPASRAIKMHKAISGSELMVIPNGTHYVPIEFPDWINLRVEKFFQSHGLIRGQKNGRRPPD
ncbi:MAG: alpha/beta hydrolase [Nitrospirae bacterium]|nr:alpha/beta hydrolase [Nitrospirota bacterium]